MDKISRYLFILLGIILFLIIAPLIVLYVSGTSLDLNNRDYRPTGILTAKTQPENALVSINGGQPEKTPATIRFLPQAEYTVRITKEDYFDWTKRLLVEPSRVTYAHEGVEALYLIKQPKPIVITPAGVTTVFMQDNTIWYGTDNALIETSLGDYEKKQSFALPFTPRSITTIRSSDYLLIENEARRKLLFHRGTKVVSALPDTFNAGTDFHLDTSGQLLLRIDTNLFAYNLQSKTSRQTLTNVVGFALLGTTAYLAHQDNGTTTLQAADWNGTEFTNSEPLLTSPLPNANNIQLIITDHKELFALAGGILYRVNSQLEMISAHVSSINIDYRASNLTFKTASELWFYNFIHSRPQLLTRSTSTVTSFSLNAQIGYGLIGTDAGLQMLEIDSRDNQNRYSLLSGKPVWAVFLSNNLKTLCVLEDSTLVLIPIQ
ncbi:MAG: PEGA domain-containing protein [bacterium]|nr:PEGA domain-containing protein [bacterium]